MFKRLVKSLNFTPPSAGGYRRIANAPSDEHDGDMSAACGASIHPLQSDSRFPVSRAWEIHDLDFVPSKSQQSSYAASIIASGASSRSESIEYVDFFQDAVDAFNVKHLYFDDSDTSFLNRLLRKKAFDYDSLSGEWFITNRKDVQKLRKMISSKGLDCFLSTYKIPFVVVDFLDSKNYVLPSAMRILLHLLLPRNNDQEFDVDTLSSMETMVLNLFIACPRKGRLYG